jgi:hypothetical protein
MMVGTVVKQTGPQAVEALAQVRLIQVQQLPAATFA